MKRVPLVFGRAVEQLADIGDALRSVREHGFGCLVIPIDQREGNGVRAKPSEHPAEPIGSAELRGAVIGSVSSWIDPDSDDPELRRTSEVCLRRELGWWAHLGMSVAVLPAPRSQSCFNYARIVNQFIAEKRDIKLVLRLTFQAEADDANWCIWNRFRTLCDQSRNIGLMLDIGDTLPEIAETDRWFGEPVFMAGLDISRFEVVGEGRRAIPESHRMLLQSLALRNVMPVLGGADGAETGQADRAYAKALQNLFEALPPIDGLEAFETQYYDKLQKPLQPLEDDIASTTYEVFEKHPVKYDHYEEAVYRALRDRHPPGERVVVMVVGAGRGPLVRRVLRAAERAERDVFVYAVEKNINAVFELKSVHGRENWQGHVEIVAADMRTWSPMEPADILVSELLGSFGDNELSPECLDGAQRYLKPETGVSIPSRTVSYLAPISSQRLHNLVSAEKQKKYFETGFVVRMYSFCQLDRAKACFQFVHPNFAAEPSARDNRRYASLTFTANANALLHGFAGYFEMTLYEDIELSIVPETKTEGLVAWFPMYWPLRHPVPVAKGERIDTQFWRQVGPRDVWYEWALSAPQCQPIQNPNGRSYKIGY